MQNTPHVPMLVGRAYRCQCGQPVFFRNSECLSCGTALGYDTALARLVPVIPTLAPSLALPLALQLALPVAPAHPFAPAPTSAAQLWVAAPTAGTGELPPTGSTYVRCANLTTPAACNWLIEVKQPAVEPGGFEEAEAAPAAQSATQAPPLLCQACRLNRTIPDLNDASHPDNGLLWGRIELAKRRLLSSLLALGLPVASLAEDPVRGLAFDLLRSPNGGSPVLTGHQAGVITLNVQEADDAVREAIRSAMREPYRTLLGHFRHEMGHYFWDRLVSGTPWLDGFRMLFGDETQNYAASLQKNYTDGPPPQWWLQHVSAYASTHPWEDWAECWAHYLHMRDTVDTALSLGLPTDSAHLEFFTAFTLDALYQPDHPSAQEFLDFLNNWMRLTTLLNEMSRSMGQPDFYPFVLPRGVVAKLHFIHLLVAQQPLQAVQAG